MGGTVKLQRQSWKVVGIFTSDGSGFESEVWGDVEVLAPAFNRAGGYPVADACGSRIRPCSRSSTPS